MCTAAARHENGGTRLGFLIMHALRCVSARRAHITILQIGHLAKSAPGTGYSELVTNMFQQNAMFLIQNTGTDRKRMD